MTDYRHEQVAAELGPEPAAEVNAHLGARAHRQREATVRLDGAIESVSRRREKARFGTGAHQKKCGGSPKAPTDGERGRELRNEETTIRALGLRR